MKILVIEDDKKPDFRTIKSSIARHLDYATVIHRKKFTEAEIDTCQADEYDLCIADILEHDGQIDFDSLPFHIAFCKGIKKISKLYQKFDCFLIIVTKVPVEHLKKQFNQIREYPEMRNLFGEHVNDLCKLDEGAVVTFTIFNNTHFHLITKPFDQYGNAIANLDIWLDELGQEVKKSVLNKPKKQI